MALVHSSNKGTISTGVRAGTSHTPLTAFPQQNMTNIKAERLLRKEVAFESSAAEIDLFSKLLSTATAESVGVATDGLNVLSKAKQFALSLDKGPYCLDFTPNGRFLAIAGASGRLASLDWQKKNLQFEIDVADQIHDISWLHNESMMAVAQSKFLYIYDHSGVELHRLKSHTDPRHVEFLPYHFLLATTSRGGMLRYLDISTGSLSSEMQTKSGVGNCVSVNRRNGVLNIGHSNGTVTLWSPAVREPLAKLFCHKGPVHACAVSNDGNYLATSGSDGQIKVWDFRSFEKCSVGHSAAAASALSFSQSDFLAAACDKAVLVWNDPVCSRKFDRPDQIIPSKAAARDIKFCPYEDVLAIGHSRGVETVLSIGSAEENFDSFEANPFATAKQRQEMEMKALLNKLPPESIALSARPHSTKPVEKEASHRKDRLTTAQKRYKRNRFNVVDHPNEAAKHAPLNHIQPLQRFVKK